MKSKIFFSVIALSLVATCSLINFNFSENTNFENYALGTQTITYWAKGTDKSIIHISAYLFDEYLKKHLEEHLILNYAYQGIKYFVIVFPTFIFLKPINQFIYFQF